MPWEMSTTGPGSEPDDGEELGDDVVPDWYVNCTKTEKNAKEQKLTTYDHDKPRSWSNPV